MLPNSFSKHSACYRCRSMKLRCPPRENNTLSCGRCLRLKVNCANPPPKDSGKAASHSISNLNRPRGSPRPSQNPHRRSSESMEPRKWSWQGSTECQSRSEGDVSASLVYPSFQSPLPSTFGISENFTPLINSERHKSTFADFEFCDFTYSEDLLLGVETPASIFSSNPLVPDTRNSGRSEAMPKVSSFVVEADPDLTGLRLSLSQRCHRPRLAATTRNSGSPSASLDKDMDESNSTGISRFGDALQDISKFLSIIEAHSQEKFTTTTDHNGSTFNSTISIVIVLDILSAYLQIVTVFDEVCAQLYDNLRTSSQGSLSELQTLPGLRLAGLAIEHGHLQMKILLQAVVHHFEMIERVLGLPMTHRVSGRLDEYTGLLKNNQQYGSLMAIVMENDCGKKTIDSLKQNLKNIAEFIYM